MDSYEPRHLSKLRAWDSTIPRFLFRGFNQFSGGNKELNTPTTITPHAFLGKSVHIKNGNLIESGVGASADPYRSTYRSRPISLKAMSLEQFQAEINGHLCGKKNMVSHFSSWTADFGTAVRFARGDYAGTHHLSRYIGVLDTSRRGDGNVVLHVRALRKESHTGFEYDYEYLVYGPVKGLSYTCLRLPRPWNIPSHVVLHPPLYAGSGPLTWLGFRTTRPLSQIRMAYNRAAHHSFCHAAATGHQTHWGSCMDTALFLTIIAAEWSQYVSPGNPGTNKKWLALISDLSQVIEWAARDTTLVLPLVNPRTDPAGSSQLTMMIRLLLRFEAEIVRLRSKQPPWPWSLIGFLWGQT